MKYYRIDMKTYVVVRASDSDDAIDKLHEGGYEKEMVDNCEFPIVQEVEEDSDDQDPHDDQDPT